MDLIQLHRPFLYKQPPNILLCTMLYSFTKGFFWVLIDRLWTICESNSNHSKVILVGTIVLTKIPLTLFYLVKTIKAKLNNSQQESKKTQSKLLFKHLIIPSIFRILLYVIVLLVLEVHKTYYMAIGFIPNLIIGEMLFQFNSGQSSTSLAPRVIGVFLMSVGAVVGVTDTNHHINPSLFLIFLATSIFVLHGEVYLNNKILKLYKPTKLELVAKYFMIEVLMFSCSYMISVFLQYMEIINQGISFSEFTQYLLAEPYFLVLSIIWALSVGCFLHLIYFSLLEVNTSSQSIFLISSSFVWYQLYLLTKNFKWNVLVAVLLGILSILLYFPSGRIKLQKMIVYMAKRRDEFEDE